MKNHQIPVAAALALVSVMGRAQTAPTYVVTTIAGNNTTGAGYSGDGAAATAAQLDGPSSVWLDSSGNIYVADQFNNVVRKFTINGNISTIAGQYGYAGYAGDTAAATAAQLYNPTTVIVDSKGNIYIADTHNSVVRMVAPGGTISTIAGNNGDGAGFSGDNPVATDAQLNKPAGLAVDSAGNLYISDNGNSRIRKVSSGALTTIAGSAFPGYSGDGGPATSAHLQSPVGLAIDAQGSLYIADAETHSIRKIANGVITTVAGNYTNYPLNSGFSGDGQQATRAQLRSPRGVAVDSCGNLYIADTLNNRIRMVMTNGVISTIAGSGNPGLPGYGGDGGPATSAQFYAPSGVAVDATGKVYVADTDNSVVRMLTPGAPLTCTAGAAPSIASGGVIGASDFGAFPTVAQGGWIEIYGSNLAADTRQWTTTDFTGINAPISLDRTTVTIGGESAFISYISSKQVNAQVPFNVGTGPLPLTVGTATGTSATYTVNVALSQPGLYAPASFNVGGKQYVAATLTDGVTFIAPPGVIPGHTSRQAKPGEIITMYGVGFGPVSTNIPAGQIVQQQNNLSLPLSMFFAGSSAQLLYDGLAPQAIGLYQFNVVVPTNIADSDLVPLTFTLNGVNGAQTLYTAVKH